MNFITKGDFLQALSDYKRLEERYAEYQKQFRDLHYLRYEKVRSPLDYEVVGYKNDETVRVIKGRGSFNPELASENNERLDSELEITLDKADRIYKTMENVRAELCIIKEPLKSWLIWKYYNGMTLKQVIKKAKLNISESGMQKLINRELDKYYE